LESLLLYVVLVASLALMLAGAYGAAPALFARRPAPVQGFVPDDQPQMFDLGPAFPLLLQRDLAPAPIEPSAINATSPLTIGSVPAFDDTDDSGEYDLDAELADGRVAGDRPQSDDDVLTDIFAEVSLLRAQIEGLRAELGGIRSQATTLAKNERSTETRRRYRNGVKADLPLSLQRQIGHIRRDRRSSRPST
jgi:hypothetical protein